MSVVARVFGLAVSALSAVASARRRRRRARQRARTTPSASAKPCVCAACGQACDLAVCDHPGRCAHCGRPLVEKGSPAATPHHGAPVAIVVFDVVPGYTFADAPPPAVLVVPGGNVHDAPRDETMRGRDAADEVARAPEYERR